MDVSLSLCRFSELPALDHEVRNLRPQSPGFSLEKADPSDPSDAQMVALRQEEWSPELLSELQRVQGPGFVPDGEWKNDAVEELLSWIHLSSIWDAHFGCNIFGPSKSYHKNTDAQCISHSTHPILLLFFRVPE